MCAFESDKITHPAHKNIKKFEILVDETDLLRYNDSIVQKNKAVKRRVSILVPFREPRSVEWGTEENAEHGLRAAQATGSL